ncbi:MAG: Proteasome subunit beta type-7, partial [Paramarteilia canceri]
VAGSGVSGDVDHLCHNAQCEALTHQAQFGKVLVENVVKPFSRNLFDHFGQLQVGLLMAGYDKIGAHLYILKSNGYYLKVLHGCEGSGSLFANSYFSSNYRYDMD